MARALGIRDALHRRGRPRAGREPSGRRQRIYKPSDAQIAFHLARFVDNVRSLSIDAVVVRQNWLKAYDFVTDRAAVTLNEYARENDPFAKVGRETVAVEVTSVVRASDTSFQVRWLERSFEGGALKDTKRLTGHVLHRHHAAAHGRAGAQEPARHLRARLQLVAGRQPRESRNEHAPLMASCWRLRWPSAPAPPGCRCRRSRSSTAPRSRRPSASRSRSRRSNTSRCPSRCRCPGS